MTAAVINPLKFYTPSWRTEDENVLIRVEKGTVFSTRAEAKGFQDYIAAEMLKRGQLQAHGIVEMGFNPITQDFIVDTVKVKSNDGIEALCVSGPAFDEAMKMTVKH